MGREVVVSLPTDGFRLKEDWQLCVAEDEEEQKEFFARVEVMDFTANCSSKKSERHKWFQNLLHHYETVTTFVVQIK